MDEHDPWSDSRLHTDHLRSWIMNIDAALLGNEASKARHRLLTEEMVRSLAAKRQDGALAHNFRFLGYVAPGEHASFVKFLGVVEALYPHKLEQFKKLLIPQARQCPWEKDPWQHPDFHECRAGLLGLDAQLLRNASLQCGLLTASMQSSLAEINASAASAAACNSQLLAFITPGEMRSFKTFLRMLSDLGYEGKRSEMERLLPAAEREKVTAVIANPAQPSQHQNGAGPAGKRNGVKTAATTPSNGSSAKRLKEAKSPPPLKSGPIEVRAQPKAACRLPHAFREINPWGHASFMKHHYTWVVTLFPTDLRLEALNARMITFEQSERLESREAEGQNAHNSELISFLRAGEATSFELFVDIVRKLNFKQRADHMKQIIDALNNEEDVPEFHLYSPWKHDDFQKHLYRQLLKGDGDAYRRWCYSKNLITKHGQTHLMALSDKGPDKHNDKLLTMLYPGEIDSFHTFLDVIKKVFPPLTLKDILPPMETLLDSPHE